MSAAQSLASHLDANSAIATSPPHFFALVWSYLTSLAAGAIDTPEERAAIEGVVMNAYDVLTAAVSHTNPIMGMAFVGFRSDIKGGIDKLLNMLAPPPPPTPAPVVVPVPTGAAP